MKNNIKIKKTIDQVIFDEKMLKNKNIFITGIGKGIGKETCKSMYQKRCICLCHH